MQPTITSSDRRRAGLRRAWAAPLAAAVAVLAPLCAGMQALADVEDDPSEQEGTVWSGDTKDHPGYGPVNPAARTSGHVEAFCEAALAAEAAASTSEDTSVIEAAFDAVSAAAPIEVKTVVDTVIAMSLSGEEGSPEFDVAYGDLIAYVKASCGFGSLTATATEYAFDGLPDTVDAGPVVVDLDNTGTEFHVLWMLRVNDGVTETLEELLALPEDESATKVTHIGGAFAAPGETGYGMIDLHPGRYIAICLLPTGATPENMPLIESGEYQGAPHFTHGMVQEFTVA